MTLEEFGSLLRAEREKRGLTIEQASEALKINPRILTALEDANTSSLPPGAYTRGFIRTYGSYLGLDSEVIQTVLQALGGMPIQSKSSSAEPPHSDPETVKSGKSGKGLWIVLIIIILGGAAYWAYSKNYFSYFKTDNTQKIDSIEKLPNAASWSAQEPASVMDQPVDPKTDAAPAAHPEMTWENKDEKAPSKQIEQENPTPVNDFPPGMPEKNSDLSQQAVNREPEKETGENIDPLKPHKLIITAIEECWVHSRADKTDTRQFSLRKGDTFALTFAKDLELKLGNAGGVSLRYDGKDLPPPGTSGQVRTLSFPPKEN